jgi:hypothetical protein
MGQMQDTLASLLASQGVVAKRGLTFPKTSDICRVGLESHVTEVYRVLGGILKPFALNLRSWDMEFDGVAVELDEYLHFNRYRLQTLQSPLYAQLGKFPASQYREFCVDHERDCLAAGGYGGKWTNPSAERQFGAAGAQKDLSGPGAPRWRQRAFYDFVKDLSPLTVGVTVVRVSMWDIIDEGTAKRTVRDVLGSPTRESARALAELIRGRKP